MSKLKSYVYAIGAFIIALLGVLLLRKTRQVESAQSDLANAVAKNRTQESDHDREIAKKEADGLVSAYDKLKRDYDNSGAGGDTDL